MKYKLVKKFDTYKEKEGTIQQGESKTNQAEREESDIYTCLKKYGVQSLVNKTQATEFLYLDNTNRNMTLDEAIRMRNDMNEYFKQQPARVRKVFGDNVDVFIEKYKTGKFDDFVSTGILNDEMVKELTEIPSEKIEIEPKPITPVEPTIQEKE